MDQKVAEKEYDRLYYQKNKEKRKQQQRDWAAQNPDSINRSSNKWRKTNPEKAIARERRWRARNPEYKHKKLCKAYGMSIDDYNLMLLKQGGLCAICKNLPTVNNRLYIDHDHVTGIVRGLLCMHCNTMLGYAKDDPIRLRMAASYIDGKIES